MLNVMGREDLDRMDAETKRDFEEESSPLLCLFDNFSGDEVLDQKDESSTIEDNFSTFLYKYYSNLAFFDSIDNSDEDLYYEARVDLVLKIIIFCNLIEYIKYGENFNSTLKTLRQAAHDNLSENGYNEQDINKFYHIIPLFIDYGVYKHFLVLVHRPGEPFYLINSRADTIVLNILDEEGKIQQTQLIRLDVQSIIDFKTSPYHALFNINNIYEFLTQKGEFNKKGLLQKYETHKEFLELLKQIAPQEATVRADLSSHLKRAWQTSTWLNWPLYILECLVEWYIGQLSLPTPIKEGRQNLRTAAIAFLRIFQIIFKGARLALYATTSPIESFKKAYHLHPALGVLNAIVSIVGIILGLMIVPYIGYTIIGKIIGVQALSNLFAFCLPLASFPLFSPLVSCAHLLFAQTTAAICGVLGSLNAFIITGYYIIKRSLQYYVWNKQKESYNMIDEQDLLTQTPTKTSTNKILQKLAIFFKELLLKDQTSFEQQSFTKHPGRVTVPNNGCVNNNTPSVDDGSTSPRPLPADLPPVPSSYQSPQMKRLLKTHKTQSAINVLESSSRSPNSFYTPRKFQTRRRSASLANVNKSPEEKNTPLLQDVDLNAPIPTP